MNPGKGMWNEVFYLKREKINQKGLLQDRELCIQ